MSSLVTTDGSTYLIQTQPGFEKIAWREVRQLDEAAEQLGFRTVGTQNGMAIFSYPDDPVDLLGLRTTEDVFFVFASAQGIPTDRSGLRALTELVRIAKQFDHGLRVHRAMREARRKGRPTFRVIARKQGHHAFRRVDVQTAVEHGIRMRYPTWRVVEDSAELEVWVTLLDQEALLTFRLSDETMRHRTYKIEHLPASLRPTAAAALAFLSDPEPADVFLDPLCGAGTILIERAHFGRYRQLLGGDVRAEAVAVARRNVGPRYKPIELRQWDATKLPLPDASVDKVASNLPFGAQVGTREQNQVLYPRLIPELTRVTRPGGRLVLLTSERTLLRRVLSAQPSLRLRNTFDVRVLGMGATIFVIDRQ